MASAEPTPLPFGLPKATEEEHGAIARKLLEAADARQRALRTRALLWAIPSLAFYLVFALGAALVLWGMGIRLEGIAFQAAVAGLFLLMGLLGQHYRSEAAIPSPDMPRILAMLILQAYILKALTSLFFIYPYLVLRNLSRLFPGRPRLDPQVLHLAVRTAAALDVPVRGREIQRLLPRDFPPTALKEALRFLDWAGAIHCMPQGGDVLITPRDEFGPVLGAHLPPRQGRITFSDLMAPSWEEAEGETGEEEEGTPAGRKTPEWLGPIGRHPVKAFLIGGAGIVGLLIMGNVLLSLYRRLPVELAPTTLPLDKEVRSVMTAEGGYYIGRSDRAERVGRLTEWSGETISLSHLAKLWSKGGMEGAESQAFAGFNDVFHVEPDPGGKYLLVYGKWKCERGSHSCGGTDLVVVDPRARTLWPADQFGHLQVKGWWDTGRLLAVQPAASWDRGGGGQLSSDNLAGQVTAIDVATGNREALFQPKEAYFGLAGREKGKRIFLAADWEYARTRTSARLRLAEYQDFKKVRSFSFKVSAFQPFISQAKLDASGKYWILVLTYIPGMAEMDQGVRYSVWIMTRNGSRWREVTGRDKCAAYMIHPLLYEGRSILTYLCDEYHPDFQAREIVLR
jgi:hypothetical protein